MGNYRCSKCGEEASSKCARSRNVFPEDQLATMIGNAMDVDANRMVPPKDADPMRYGYNSDAWDVTLRISVYGAQTDEEAIATAMRRLHDNPMETILRAVCHHDWRLIAGKCNFGCCEA